jgi:hypothetical protein
MNDNKNGGRIFFDSELIGVFTEQNIQADGFLYFFFCFENISRSLFARNPEHLTPPSPTARALLSDSLIYSDLDSTEDCLFRKKSV